ncbi:MAG: hypothetical protein AAGF04_00280 [Chlamydiota bacterium]
MNWFTYSFFLGFLFCLSSCASWAYEEEDLSTVPVTNNPHIVPQHGSGMPMMPG